MTQTVTMRDLLAPQAVVATLEATGKKDALQNITNAAGALWGTDPLKIFDILWERERLGTTGVGHGIAIPHGRLAGLDKVVGFFARLSQPIAFDAIDDKPVDLIFLLLAPEAAGADHLQALAAISRQLRDPKLCDQLRKSKDEKTIYQLLVESPAVQAA